jgi:hypothetical protein
LSYKISARQLASENDRSATEFLRSQRQAAYTAFAAEANAFFNALSDANLLFRPDDPPPTLEVFKTADSDVSSHFPKLLSANLNLDLVASEDVCAAALDESHLLSASYNQHVGAAFPYVDRQKPPDDLYRKIWMTNDDYHGLASAFVAFTRAARDDLSDPALRKPAKNCPRT